MVRVMNDLLFPASDAGVLAQAMLIAVVGLGGLAATRRRPELRIVVIGLWLVAYGGIGVRALH